MNEHYKTSLETTKLHFKSNLRLYTYAPFLLKDFLVRHFFK